MRSITLGGDHENIESLFSDFSRLGRYPHGFGSVPLLRLRRLAGDLTLKLQSWTGLIRHQTGH